MRLSFATWALEGNEEKGIAPTPILAVRDWMGHASVKETEGYLHRSNASHSKAVAFEGGGQPRRLRDRLEPNRPPLHDGRWPHRPGRYCLASRAARKAKKHHGRARDSTPTRPFTPQYATTLRVLAVRS
jgi:hypothetical protein